MHSCRHQIVFLQSSAFCVAVDTEQSLCSKAQFVQLHIGYFGLLLVVTSLMTAAELRLAKMDMANEGVCQGSVAILQAMHGSAKALIAADVHDRFHTRVCASLSQRNSVSRLGWAQADKQAVTTAPVWKSSHMQQCPTIDANSVMHSFVTHVSM